MRAPGAIQAQRLSSRVRAALALSRAFAGPRSALTVRGLARRAACGPPGVPVAVRVRELGGGEVWVRPGSTDVSVLIDTFMRRFHLPPETVSAQDARTIWDLGANVGYTAAHLAALHPHARVWAVELDGSNAELARRNLAAYGDRCRLLEAGVWVSEGTVRYRPDAGNEWGLRIVQDPQADVGAGATAPALTLNRLAELTGAERVDYVKMDIEGAEEQVLASATEWAALVAAIKVEVHAPYSTARCSEDLRALGFRTLPDARHPACVIGLREP